MAASDDHNLMPGDPRVLADAIPLSRRFEGSRCVHEAYGYMAAIVAERVIRRLESRLQETAAWRALTDRARIQRLIGAMQCNATERSEKRQVPSSDGARARRPRKRARLNVMEIPNVLRFLPPR
jgi:hypothetical protein